MRTLLIGLISLCSFSVFAQNMNCGAVEDPNLLIIKVESYENIKIVNFLKVSNSFSGLPNLRLLFNEQGEHIGYQEQILGREDGIITQILNINYDLQSIPRSGEYILVDEFSVDLICKSTGK